MCAKKQGLAAGFRGWLAALSRQIEAHVPSMLEAEALRQLFSTGQKFQLARPFARDSTQSRGQAARTPCLAKYDVSHFFSPYYIYTLIPTIQRELPERILKEKS